MAKPNLCVREAAKRPSEKAKEGIKAVTKNATKRKPAPKDATPSEHRRQGSHLIVTERYTRTMLATPATVYNADALGQTR